MAFMTPQQYGQLIFKIFFKGMSLRIETESWNKTRLFKHAIQANIYNFIFGILIVYLIGQFVANSELHFVLKKSLWGLTFGIIFGIIRGAILDIKDGISGSITISVIWGLAWGIALGVICGIPWGPTWIVAWSIALVIIGALASFISMNIRVTSIRWSVVGFVTATIVWGVAGAVLSLFSYTIIWLRWFYVLPLLAVIQIRLLQKNIAFHRLPFHWDENISTPVPLLSETLLRMSRYNRATTLEEATFLIQERPFQRIPAQYVLVRIAVDEMLQFRDLRNIANLPQELAFLPKENLFLKNYSTRRHIFLPPKALIEFYNQGYGELSTFAADAHTALAESNTSNRLRILERLVADLNNFQKRMDFAKKSISIPFGQISRRWLEIVQKEIKQIETDVGRPLLNPFIVGVPIKPDSEMFIGRKDIIEQIQYEALREGGAGAILFIGNRRTGKTSTLLNLKRYLLSSLKPMFFDCQNPIVSSSINRFCKTISNDIDTALAQTSVSTHECNSLADLTGYLQAVQKDLQEKNKHLLICFDEYESLTEKIISGEFADLPNTFRYWVQHLPRTICLFSGSHQLDEIPQFDWTNYLINVRSVPISYLNFDSALRLVTIPIPHFDLQYEAGVDDTEKLVRRLGCQPFLLQATMSELVNYLNSLGRKVARQEDIDIAIERMFQSWPNYFEHTWNKENNAMEREVLVAIAKQNPIRQDTDKALRSLVRKEILRQEDGNYAFCVPVFQEWIISNS